MSTVPTNLRHEEWYAIKHYYAERMKYWAEKGDFEAVERMTNRCREIQAAMPKMPAFD